MSVASYWETRYRQGGTSGPGSRGDEAELKVSTVQSVIDALGVRSMLDLGCGDGHVAAGLWVERYVGYDPSATARALCRSALRGHEGAVVVDEVPDEAFDLLLSMDVMHHLVTEESYRAHLATLFSGLAPHVLVYGTDHDQRGAAHVLHRHWTPEVPEGWQVHETPTRFKTAWLISQR